MMKRRYVKKILCLMTAAALTAQTPAVLFAQENTQETENGENQRETGEDFVIPFEDGEIAVTNETAQTITEAKLTEEKGESREDASWELTLKEEGGQVHTFSNVDPKVLKEPVLINSYEFLYLVYKDEAGKEQEFLEKAEERELEEALTMYFSANVHIRKEPDKEAESLKVAQLGGECKVTGMVPGWYQVEAGDVKGYAYHSYVTEDKEAVDALVKKKQEEEAAAAQAAAAAAAAAQQAAAQQAAAQAAPQAKTEVSRQAYDDCDGSGHGYYEITWSDGSVTYEEY